MSVECNKLSLRDIDSFIGVDKTEGSNKIGNSIWSLNRTNLENEEEEELKKKLRIWVNINVM